MRVRKVSTSKYIPNAQGKYCPSISIQHRFLVGIQAQSINIEVSNSSFLLFWFSGLPIDSGSEMIGNLIGSWENSPPKLVSC